MQETSKKRIYGVFFIITMLLLFMYGLYKKNDIKESFEISVARISKTHESSRGYLGYEYEFFFKNEKYTNSGILFTSYYAFNEIFINKFIPVVFSKKNPNNSELLLQINDFEEYNMTYPDSLNWLLEIQK